MQRNTCTALLTFDSLNGELALSVRLPAHRLISRQAGATCFNNDFVCNDESRVKTDTELPDKIGIVFLVTGHLLEKFGRA